MLCAKYLDTIFVLHAFDKITNGVDRLNIDTAQQRYKELIKRISEVDAAAKSRQRSSRKRQISPVTSGKLNHMRLYARLAFLGVPDEGDLRSEPDPGQVGVQGGRREGTDFPRQQLAYARLRDTQDFADLRLAQCLEREEVAQGDHQFGAVLQIRGFGRGPVGRLKVIVESQAPGPTPVLG
jgi:hypothetical protein